MEINEYESIMAGLFHMIQKIIYGETFYYSLYIYNWH